MKYTEFLFNHGFIHADEIQLNESNNYEGKAIAKALGIRFIGYWEDAGKYLFSDDRKTGTSFVAKDMEEAKRKLKETRIAFEV